MLTQNLKESNETVELLVTEKEKAEKKTRKMDTGLTDVTSSFKRFKDEIFTKIVQLQDSLEDKVFTSC